MTRVIIESPFAGDIKKNILYAKRCLMDSIERDEAPFASHLLYTQVLDDTIDFEREAGMNAGFKWMGVADLVAVYGDLGISSGMKKGIELARKLGIKIEYRYLRR